MESKSRAQKPFVIGLVLSLLLGTPTSLLSLDRKRRSHVIYMRNHKAVLTRSERSTVHSTMITTPTLSELVHPAHRKSSPKYFCSIFPLNQQMITSNKLNMGFFMTLRKKWNHSFVQFFHAERFRFGTRWLFSGYMLSKPNWILFRLALKIFKDDANLLANVTLTLIRTTHFILC